MEILKGGGVMPNKTTKPMTDNIEEKKEIVVEKEETVVENNTSTGVVFNCQKLNVRKKASPASEVLGVIDADSEVIIDLDKSTKSFYKVTTESGIEGFCMTKYIKKR